MKKTVLLLLITFYHPKSPLFKLSIKILPIKTKGTYEDIEFNLEKSYYNITIFLINNLLFYNVIFFHFFNIYFIIKTLIINLDFQ